MKRNYLEDIVTVVLATSALVIAGIAVSQRIPRNSAARAEATANWERYAFPGTEMGRAGARITVIEFSDFQCPFCASAARVLSQLQQTHPMKIRIVFRHFPVMRQHEHAYDAAIAAECAAMQGRFREYHDALFREQNSIGNRPWTAFAMVAGVQDTATFEGCVRSRQPSARIDEDMNAARELKISGTPLLLINGRMMVTGDSARIHRAIVAAIQ